MKTLATCVVLLVVLLQNISTAQITETMLTASDGETEDEFAWSASISGDYVIVGAPKDNDKGQWSGSAYIFKRNGDSWAQQTKLTASDGTQYEEFGFSVSIDGDYAIVGAPRTGQSGHLTAAFVFKRDGENWMEQAILTVNNATQNDFFGTSVSIEGEYAAVGHINDGNTRQGSVYIFKRDGENWTEQSKLIASDSADQDHFGTSISMSGDFIIVGSLRDDTGKSGIAYIFKREGTSWIEQAKLTASDVAQYDNFGESVAVSGDYAIVGSSFDDDQGFNSGSAYIFRREGANWIEHVKLTASVAAHSFGASVAIANDFAIVGALGDGGAAYIFKHDDANWTEQVKLTGSDATIGDAFGRVVSISGDEVVVGAYAHTTRKGKAYVYTGLSTVVGIEEAISGIPTNFTLEQNYPNPFNPSTVINYELSSVQHVELTIHNQLGQGIKILVKERQPSGAYQIEWDGRDYAGKQVASGVYLYRLKAGSFVETRKMVLLR